MRGISVAITGTVDILPFISDHAVHVLRHLGHGFGGVSHVAQEDRDGACGIDPPGLLRINVNLVHEVVEMGSRIGAVSWLTPL